MAFLFSHSTWKEKSSRMNSVIISLLQLCGKRCCSQASSPSALRILSPPSCMTSVFPLAIIFNLSLPWFCYKPFSLEVVELGIWEHYLRCIGWMKPLCTRWLCEDLPHSQPSPEQSRKMLLPVYQVYWTVSLFSLSYRWVMGQWLVPGPKAVSCCLGLWVTYECETLWHRRFAQQSHSLCPGWWLADPLESVVLPLSLHSVKQEDLLEKQKPKRSHELSKTIKYRGRSGSGEGRKN